MNDTRFIEAAEKAWREEVLRKAPNAKPHQATPTLYYLGGQPGAGKSKTSKKIRRQLSYNALYISMDDFREYHPNFNELYKTYGKNSSEHTHAFARACADYISQKAADNGYNVILEGTFKSYENTTKNIKLYQLNGYEVNIAVCTCPEELSLFGTKERVARDIAEGRIARAVPTDIHDEAVRALPINAQRLFEEVKHKSFAIYSRGNEIFDNQKAEYVGKKPYDVIKNELNRRLTDKELLQYMPASRIKTKNIISSKLASFKSKQINQNKKKDFER